MSDHHIDPRLQDVIDKLCNDGCRAVSQHILDIESGNFPVLMQGFSTSDVQLILKELKEIMAVYDRCEGNNPSD